MARENQQNLFSGNSVDSSQVSPAQTRYKLGRALAEKGRWEEAIAHYRQALELDPNLTQAQQALDQALAQNEENSQTRVAVSSESSNASSSITSAQTHYQMGQALAKKGRSNDAIARYRKALELDPSLTQAQQALDELLAQGEAISQTTAPLEDSNRNNGNLRSKQTTKGQSLQSENSNGNLVPEQTAEGQTYRKRSQQYAQQGQWQQAARELQQLIQVEPSFEAYRDLGRVQSYLQQPAEAANSWYQAVSIAPERLDAEEVGKLGNTLVQQKQYEAAATCYRQALERYPNWFQVGFNLATALARQEQWEEAIAAYRNAIEINSQSAKAHQGLAMALERQELWEDAIASYRQAMSLQPEEQWVGERLVTLLEHQQDWEQLEIVCRQGIEHHPDVSRFHHVLGNALLKLGRWEEAAQAYRSAIALEPNFSWSHNSLGDALSSLQYWQEARQSYQNAKNLNPNLAGINEKIANILKKQQNGDLRLENVSVDDSEQRSQENPKNLQKYYKALEYNQAHIARLHSQSHNLSRTQAFNRNFKDESAVSISVNSETESATQVDNKVGENSNNHQHSNNPSTNYNPKFSKDHIEKYREALKARPNEWELQVEFAETLISRGQIEEGIQHYYEILSLNPDQVNVYQTIVESLYNVLYLSKKVPQLDQLYQLLWEHHLTAQLKLEYGRWLASGIIYIEGFVDSSWVLGQAKLILFSNDNYQIVSAYFFQISDQEFAAIAILEETPSVTSTNSCQIAVLHGNRFVKVNGFIAGKAPGLEFVEYLNQKPEHPRKRIREQINNILINFSANFDYKNNIQELLNKLQKFIQISTFNLVDPNLPFNIFVDKVIPTQNKGIFISGWLRDLESMLTEIEIISDLGFSLKLAQKNIYKYTRSDVNQFLSDNGCQVQPREKLGFCAYINIPEEICNALDNVAELYGFRLIVRLKGDIEYEICPDIKQYDPHFARSAILGLVDGSEVSDELLENCLGIASHNLQQVCAQQAAIKETLSFGNTNNNPLISIVIPIYKRLEFIKLQFATMANDYSLQQCELIYVLDSPEQEQEVINMLSEYSALYNLPVRLVVMNINSGYACANNMGVSQARGHYVVLMNSDVVPKTKEWALEMAVFQDSSPQIGPLAPKLVYEDNALQHAGMYFEKNRFPFWLNLHYYKGFPSTYEPAQVSYSVPAVTGACLMINRKLYEKVGGLSTDYVIGDFEDSDLCLKCASLGYESWYFADVALYHFERQSVPLNSNYTGSLALRYNAHLHTRRWNKLIEELMLKYTSY